MTIRARESLASSGALGQSLLSSNKTVSSFMGGPPRSQSRHEGELEGP